MTSKLDPEIEKDAGGLPAMTETKAAEPTTEELATRLRVRNTDGRTLDSAADRLLSLSREVEAKDAEIAKLTTERDDARREADRAQARAARIAEMDPEGEMADDDMQEALREIESLQVQNVRRENEIAALASRCEALTELLNKTVES